MWILAHHFLFFAKLLQASFLSAESFSSALHVVPEEKKKKGKEKDFFQKNEEDQPGASLGDRQYEQTDSTNRRTDVLMNRLTDEQMNKRTDEQKNT